MPLAPQMLLLVTRLPVPVTPVRRLIRAALPMTEAAHLRMPGRRQPAVPNLAPAREPLRGLLWLQLLQPQRSPAALAKVILPMKQQ